MEPIKVICDSEITIVNLKTGYIYKDEAEAQADTTVDPKDIRRDVKIIVPPKVTNWPSPIFTLLQRLINNHSFQT